MWMRTEGKILVIKDLLKSIPGSQGQASTALLKLKMYLRDHFYWSANGLLCTIVRHLVKVLRSFSCQTTPCLHLVLTSIDLASFCDPPLQMAEDKANSESSWQVCTFTASCLQQPNKRLFWLAGRAWNIGYIRSGEHCVQKTF